MHFQQGEGLCGSRSLSMHCKISSSVDTSIMCLPPPDVTSSSYWETAQSTDNVLHIVSCFTFTKPLPAPPAADIHITNCVSSVVVSNGGEWHWNKNKDVIIPPSCRELWSWSHKGVKKKFLRKIPLTPLHETARRSLFVCWYIVNVWIVDRDRRQQGAEEHQTPAQLQ